MTLAAGDGMARVVQRGVKHRLAPQALARARNCFFTGGQLVLVDNFSSHKTAAVRTAIRSGGPASADGLRRRSILRSG